ncbi:copper homeostasis protein CutC [Cytobacillus oceanisediminis]|uniref:PF03932 family protein CutC n=1 Tax=Cytobacillus oceanisediminis 2691 TaxID=1196031 RepID=A0A160MCI5_9BACI|nr:copper homeostasis protein CutC [Cytobacillus oceanisediminis]AND40699.1 copper homeostasis protein [Cytobacillus oceanisediminis 2691]MCM3401184.1 copper homeostasis protein CutC [Cytobacillus oceanisediminis]
MLIEVIADTLSDALIAQEAGAGRIELVTGLAEGGLTPGYGVIERVCKELKIPVNVMIRPHSRGFFYSEEDLDIMIQDIKVCNKLGAAGVVLGVLTPDHQVHNDHLKRLIDAAGGLDITFHRAFDEADDQFAALESLKQYPQISRILTSGGRRSAADAAERLKSLYERTANSHLKIMAGAGLSIENISVFLDEVPVTEVHFGTGVRVESSYEHAIDPERVQKVKKIIGA